MMWSLLARSRFFRQVVITAVGTLACALAINVEPAAAQLTSVAQQTAFGASTGVDAVDAAYDPVHNYYLVVGARNHVTGAWVNANGVPVTGTFPIKAQAAGSVPYGAKVHVKYSAYLGGFLVVWAEEEADHTVRIHMQTLRYPNILRPTDVPILDSQSYLTNVGGIAVGYSETSHRFLVAYMTNTAEMRVQLVDYDGTLIGPSVKIADRWARDPSIAWNSATNEFGVAYSLEPSDNHFASGFSIVSPSNAATFHSWTFNASATGRTTWTSLDFNPSTNHYVMVWWEAKAKAAEIASNGTVLTMGTVSTVVGRNSYDGLSAAFNPASGTMWLVGMTGPKDWDVAGLELNGHGVALGSYRIIGQNSGVPQGYVRVASATTPGWLAVYNRNWQSVVVEGTTTSTTGGGSTATFAAYSAGSSSSGGSTGSGSTSTPPPSGATCGGAAKPVSNWVCVSDSMGTGWLPPDNPRTIKFLSGGSTTTTPPPTTTTQDPPPSTPPPTTSSCTTAKPVSNWICVNGGWLPPDHPLAIAYMSSHTTSTSQGSTTPPPTNPYAPCVTPPPGSGWVCTAQGNWLPPDNPDAIPAMPTCPSSYGTAPGHGWIRVGDGWVPADHPLAVNGTCKAP